jgi:pyruvate,water dikinase
MVRSDMASSGVAFTLDPDTGFCDVVAITGSYGLGESVVGGKVDPDEVQVFKPMIHVCRLTLTVTDE